MIPTREQAALIAFFDELRKPSMYRWTIVAFEGWECADLMENEFKPGAVRKMIDAVELSIVAYDSESAINHAKALCHRKVYRVSAIRHEPPEFYAPMEVER